MGEHPAAPRLRRGAAVYHRGWFQLTRSRRFDSSERTDCRMRRGATPSPRSDLPPSCSRRVALASGGGIGRTHWRGTARQIPAKAAAPAAPAVGDTVRGCRGSRLRNLAGIRRTPDETEWRHVRVGCAYRCGRRQREWRRLAGMEGWRLRRRRWRRAGMEVWWLQRWRRRLGRAGMEVWRYERRRRRWRRAGMEVWWLQRWRRRHQGWLWGRRQRCRRLSAGSESQAPTDESPRSKAQTGRRTQAISERQAASGSM